MRFAVLAGVMALVPCSAVGQALPLDVPSDPSRILSGDSLRVKLPFSPAVKGVFLGWEADRLQLQVDGMTQV